MPQETAAPLPLTGAEVKEAILYKVAQSLERDCHLKDDAAYTSFRGDIVIHLLLNDYGREQADNHIVAEQQGEIAPETEPIHVQAEIEAKPPNQVRIETGQDIPVKVIEDGKQVIKHVKYQARKKAK